MAAWTPAKHHKDPNMAGLQGYRGSKLLFANSWLGIENHRVFHCICQEPVIFSIMRGTR